MSSRDGEKALNKLLFFYFLKYVSLTIPLIVSEAPNWITYGLPLLVFSPVWTIFIFSEDTAVVWGGLFEFVYNLLLRPSFYIWGFVATVQGEQDFVAIAFYIIAGLQLFNVIKKFFFYAISLISMIKR